MSMYLFLIALAINESDNNAYAYRYKEGARGCLQIRQIMLDDVNRISGKHFLRKDCYNPGKAFEMANIYFNRYAPPNPTAIQLAQLWKGGPDAIVKGEALEDAKIVESIYRDLIVRTIHDRKE
jgi:hypothetical protein